MNADERKCSGAVAAAGAHVIRQGIVVALFNTVPVGLRDRETPHPTTPEPDRSLDFFLVELRRMDCAEDLAQETPALSGIFDQGRSLDCEIRTVAMRMAGS